MSRSKTSAWNMLRGMSDGACVTDARGAIEYMNPAAERFLGKPLSACARKPLCGLLCRGFSDPKVRARVARCPLRRRGSRKSSVVVEGRYQPDGRDEGFDLSVHCFRLPGPGGASRRLTLLQDESARIALEKRREDWRTMVVHDLNAPLSNIYAVARELRDQAAAGQTADAGIADIAVQNCRRMMDLLQLYLAVARLDASLMPVSAAPLDLVPLVRTCAAEQAFLAAERKITLTVDAPATLTALGDAQLFSRALQNLIHNALKFSLKESRVEITAARDESGRVRVSVRDQGPGIPEEDLVRVFDRFAQARGLRRIERAGIGLGLTFCREALAAMKGELTVQSRPGEGCLFTLYLPSAEASR